MLKKQRSSSRAKSHEVQVHRGTLRQLPSHRLCDVMVAGVVRDDMDPLVAGIAGLQLLKQRDGGSGVDPLGRDRGKVSFPAWARRGG